MHETNGSHCPRKSSRRKQLTDHAREDETSGDAAAGGDAESESATAQEVRGQDGEGWAEDASVRNTEANTLSEQEMPVLRADGNGKYGHGQQDGADDED